MELLSLKFQIGTGKFHGHQAQPRHLEVYAGKTLYIGIALHISAIFGRCERCINVPLMNSADSGHTLKKEAPVIQNEFLTRSQHALLVAESQGFTNTADAMRSILESLTSIEKGSSQPLTHLEERHSNMELAKAGQ